MDKTKLAVDLFDKYAQQYQDKFMNVDLYQDTLDFFCREIPQASASILDLACGPGNITKYILSKRPDFQVLGCDLSPQMIELAKVNNPSAKFQLMDCRAISSLGQKYDGIICGFGLHYLSKEEAIQLIRDASEALQPLGLLYLSTMEDQYSNSGFKGPSSGGEDVLYQYYHEAEYLTQALEDSGFEVIDLQRKTTTEPDGKQTIDLVISARLQKK